MKTISPPDLTAYALNELPPDAAAELTRLLTDSPADAASAEETRAFCELLSTTLAAPEGKEGAGLSAEQKQVITENLPSTKVVTSFRWTLWAGTGAAAAVAAWLALPQGYPQKSSVATESPTPLEDFLPGGGGGGPRSQSNTSYSVTLKSSKEAALAEAPKLAMSTLRETGDYANNRPKKELAQSDEAYLYAATPPAEPQAAMALADPQSRTGGKIESDERDRSQDLYAAERRFPKDAKPSAPVDAIRSAPMTAATSANTSPAPAPLVISPVEESESVARGAIAENKPIAKRGEMPEVRSKQREQAASAPLDDRTTQFGVGIASTDKAGSSDGPIYDLKHDLSFHAGIAAAPPQATPSAESYIAPPENPFKQVAAEPLSTFSIDVDTASYANVRRFLNMGQRPPAEAVRVEELVNYFRYAYPAPEAGKPCSLTADLVVCPWNEHHRLARVAVKARTDENRPKANLVFLLDVSGSMNEPNKLPLVKQSLKLLVDKLTENDRVSIVVYAGASGVVLPPTHGENKKAILGAIDNLQPGGSTNGASGIALAYEMARKEFLKEGVNRVILATDGDFNVGISDRDGLQSLIEKEAKSGVFLSVLGYGMGNLKDSTMETLADKGNGNYAYIDSLGEARKVLSEEMASTLVTVAKDVKIQIEFNPGKVRAYKLLGYENRMLAKEDFNDDKKDAGEMGAGHTVTALYEITPVDAPADVPPVDPLKYQPLAKAEEKPVARPDSPEIMTVKLRYKAPDADVSQLMELPVMDKNAAVASAPGDFQFATAVAGYGLLLRGSKQVGNLNWEMIRTMAKAGKGEDPDGYRGEFMQLIEKAAGALPVP